MCLRPPAPLFLSSHPNRRPGLLVFLEVIHRLADPFPVGAKQISADCLLCRKLDFDLPFLFEQIFVCLALIALQSQSIWTEQHTLFHNRQSWPKLHFLSAKSLFICFASTDVTHTPYLYRLLTVGLTSELPSS